MIGKVYAGARSPEKIRVVFTGPAGIDLTEVIGITAEVMRPTGNKSQWIFSIDPQRSAGRIIAVRVFAVDGRDVVEAGNYRLGFKFEFPGSIFRRSAPIPLPVSAWP